VKTIVVSVGNSDNKLIQEEWSRFVHDIDSLIRVHAKQVHFFGGAPNWMPWQNTAWMFDCEDIYVKHLKEVLAATGREYNQDAVAYLEGETQFL
jgi:hypothetical protein